MKLSIYLNRRAFEMRLTLFVSSCLLSCISIPSRKGSTLKGENMIQKEHTFSFRIDLYSEVNSNNKQDDAICLTLQKA